MGLAQARPNYFLAHTAEMQAQGDGASIHI